MMKTKKQSARIREIMLAAIGGLFVLLYGCGYGGDGETILIGTSEVQKTGSAPYGGGDMQKASEPPVGEEGALPKDGQDTLIRVYVCGSVVNPGVVSVPDGSRVEDALMAAGGFSPEAARQELNLAGWLTDGQMLYFPSEGEVQKRDMGEAAGTWPGTDSGTGQETGGGLVNINTADVQALVTLPGIGEGRARDIIAFREKHGDFACCEDIMKVSGIKTSIYDKICDKITVK